MFGTYNSMVALKAFWGVTYVPPATSFQVRGSGKIMTDNLNLFGIDNIVKTSANQV